MRMKFEKGMTPESIGKVFANFIRDNNIIIGAVNMYFQTYDEEMKAEKFGKFEGEYFVCKPSEQSKVDYEQDVANIRRKRMKAVI